MPVKRQRTKTTSEPSKPQCQHQHIQTEPSTHGTEVGYVQPPAAHRAKAQGLKPSEVPQFTDRPYSFPAPLVLPGDDLALDPEYPGQSLLSWTRLKSRNTVTNRRKTIYVAAPPQFDRALGFAESWSTPTSTPSQHDASPVQPDIHDVVDYISAFYYPLPVQVLPSTTFEFTSWSSRDTSSLRSSQPTTATIGLRTPAEIVGIRTRPTPDQDVTAFSHQLNLNDILDAAISSIPDDAYALLMLVSQDLYEDEDDDFVCGRAYGGSRVAVVSYARYNPVLDAALSLDLAHVWPLSHCTEFVDGQVYSQQGQKRSKKQKKSKITDGVTTVQKDNTPMQSAFSAALTPYSSSTPESQTIRWLSRICRTAVHELGHCFGIDHCVYYACCMQGSASLLEDARQPPYLCPVDLAKVLKETGATEEEHLRALREYCCKFKDGKKADEMLVAFEAWLTARLGEQSMMMVG